MKNAHGDPVLVSDAGWQIVLNGPSTARVYGTLMVDTLSILLTHSLLLIGFWRLARRPELDQESLETRLEEPAETSARPASPGPPRAA